LSLFEGFEEKPPEIRLRRYQSECLSAIQAAQDRGVRRALIVLPTGTGKTTVFSEATRLVTENPAATVVILAHRQELLEQAAARIRRQCPGLKVTVQSGSSKAQRGSNVVVASVQSVGRGGSNLLDWMNPTMVIVDEAHHAAASTYQNFARRMGCYEDEGPFYLGVTATDNRLDGLALSGSDTAIFQEKIYQYSILQAIREGYLVDIKGFRVGVNLNLDDVKVKGGDYDAGQLEKKLNTEPVNEAAYKAWEEAAKDRRTIVFCAGVSHAENVAQVFQDKGVPAAHVYGDMSPEARKRTIEDFRTGRIQVITNCEILTEGFDSPEIGCVLLLRPTQSWSLFVQMLGRGLRPLAGCADGVDDDILRAARVAGSAKPNCVVIDVVDNTSSHLLTDKPKGNELPSIQKLADLPSSLDMEGMSLAEAAEQWDELPEEAREIARRRRTSFSGLSASLEQVNLLAELDVPQEADSASAQLQWLKVGPMEYVVNLFYHGGEEDRQARMVGELDGSWRLNLTGRVQGMGMRDQWFPLPADVTMAFAAAEAKIRATFLGTHLSKRGAQWRVTGITDAQRKRLITLGVAESVIDQLANSGQAQGLIDRLTRGNN